MPSSYLCIDANTLLNLYQKSEDDLGEVRKLIGLASADDDFKVVVPEQVKKEFQRRRDAQVKEALAKLNELKVSLPMPGIAQGRDDKKIRKLAGKINARLKTLHKTLKSEGESRSLPADNLINELLASADLLKSTGEIVEAARDRGAAGDPPRKKSDQNLGDAIIWETLLEYLPNGADLHLVSSDGDFYSDLVPEEPNPYLANEWNSAKTGEMLVYKGLSKFFAAVFPGIQLAEDFEKRPAIREFVESTCFQATHEAVARLEKIGSFSDQEANQMLEAAKANSQISWILSDSDVERFLKRIVRDSGDGVSNELRQHFEEDWDD